MEGNQLKSWNRTKICIVLEAKFDPQLRDSWEIVYTLLLIFISDSIDSVWFREKNRNLSSDVISSLYNVDEEFKKMNLINNLRALYAEVRRE